MADMHERTKKAEYMSLGDFEDRVCIFCGEPAKWGACEKCEQEWNAQIKEYTIEIPKDKLLGLRDLYSGDMLGVDQARGIFGWKGKQYVIHGYGYDRNSSDDRAWAHEVIPAELHEGPTHSYEELRDHNLSGHAYSNNQKFKCHGAYYVVVPFVHVTFVSNKEPIFQQNKLF
jgi:hypothetical protein